jgi:hypothetical protein
MTARDGVGDHEAMRVPFKAAMVSHRRTRPDFDIPINRLIHPATVSPV